MWTVVAIWVLLETISIRLPDPCEPYYRGHIFSFFLTLLFQISQPELKFPVYCTPKAFPILLNYTFIMLVFPFVELRSIISSKKAIFYSVLTFFSCRIARLLTSPSWFELAAAWRYLPTI